MVKEREKHRKELINEAVSGETKLDILSDNTTISLCGEAEAMYFKTVRDFFKTSYAKIIMSK